MGALSFPYNYLCSVFRHAIHLGCSQSSRFVAHRGSQHTQPCFALAFTSSDSILQLLLSNAKAVNSVQHYHKDLHKRYWLSSPPHSSAFSLLLHEARGVLLHHLTALNDSLRLRPRDTAWERWTLSTSLPMWQTHHFLVPKQYFQEHGVSCKGVSSKVQKLAMWCASLLQYASGKENILLLLLLIMTSGSRSYQMYHETSGYNCCREKLCSFITSRCFALD